MDNTPVTTPNSNMKKFLILIIAAVVIVAGVAVGIFFATRGGSDGKEYQPNNDLWSGEDPSGYDDDHTARY